MSFLLGFVLGWILLKQPEWAERQVNMIVEKIKAKISKKVG